MTLGSRMVPSRRWGLLLVLLALLPARLTGQDSLPPADDACRKPIATRADLESALNQAEQIAASDGYSAELRDQKRAEAALIRERLREGDFQVGDQITVKVEGDSSLSGTMTVGPGKIISLANYGDIPMT